MGALRYIPPTQGTQVLTNPTITGSATGWTLGSGWSYSSNGIVCDGSSNNASQANVLGTSGFDIYLAIVVVSSRSAGSISVGESDAISSVGTHYRYFAAPGADLIIDSTSFNGKIDSCHVYPLSYYPGDAFQTVTTEAADYRVEFDLTIDAGTLSINIGELATNTYTTSGHKSFIVTDGSGGSPAVRFSDSLGTLSCKIDNVSVRKVLGNASLGSELITNGGFNTSATGWTLNTELAPPTDGWSYYASNELQSFLPVYSVSLSSAVKFVEQDTGTPSVVIGGIGGVDEDEYALFKKSTSYELCVWRSKVYQIGKKFDIQRISFPIYPAITSNMGVVVSLYFDNETSVSTATTINSTNYSNSEKRITLYPSNFGNKVRGKFNFFLEFQFTGSALATVGLPVDIDLETIEN